MEIPKFSDLVESKTLSGDKKKLEDVLDKPIVITGCKISNSKYQKTESCTTIQCYFADDETETRYVLFTGSTVIRDQIEEITQKLADAGKDILFSTTISKIGKYHALT